MTNIEKVDFAVTPEMAATLRDPVSSGEYPTEGEVVREALREWMSRRQRRQEAVEELKALLDEGRNSGPLIDSDEAFDGVFAELDAMDAE